MACPGHARSKMAEQAYKKEEIQNGDPQDRCRINPGKRFLGINRFIKGLSAYIYPRSSLVVPTILIR